MPEQLITIKTFQYPAEAEAARMHLAEEGIPAYLSDAETVNMDWLLGNALGYVKLQVASDQAERAAALLEQGAPAQQEAKDGDRDPDAERCLSCNAPIPDDATSCPTCGWTYSEDAAGPEEEAVRPSVGRELPEDGPRVLDSLTMLKRPIILFFLWPVFLGVLLLGLLILARLVGLLGGLLRWS